MKRLIPVVALIVLVNMHVSTCQAIPSTLAEWNFETIPFTIPANTAFGPLAPDTGLSTGALTGLHAQSSVWDAGVGNGSPKSLAVTTWAKNDYVQFQVNASGYKDLSFSWDQTYDPQFAPPFATIVEFVLKWSVDGTTFTTTSSPASYDYTGSVWEHAVKDFSGITAMNNDSSIFFRLSYNIDNNALGSIRFDNVKIEANPIPEPTAVTLLSAGLLGLVTQARRKVRHINRS